MEPIITDQEWVLNEKVQTTNGVDQTFFPTPSTWVFKPLETCITQNGEKECYRHNNTNSTLELMGMGNWVGNYEKIVNTSQELHLKVMLSSTSWVVLKLRIK